jgi:D-alanyl-D-alanine carboxypeptidase
MKQNNKINLEEPTPNSYIINFWLKKRIVEVIGFILNFLAKYDFELRPALIGFLIVIGIFNLIRLSQFSLDEIMSFSRTRPINSFLSSIPINALSFHVNPSNSGKVLIPTIPEKILKLSQPEKVMARSFIVYDNLKQKEIFSKEKNLNLPPASLVKMLSVLYLTKNSDLEEIVTIPANCTVVQGQKVGFKVNEEVSLKDLLYSTLIFSGGDSVCALAFRDPSYSIQGLNDLAKSIGMKDSNFTNYIGLDFEGNITTAEDMLYLTLEFIKRDLLNEIVTYKEFKLENGKVVLNTNKALNQINGTVGIKTGTTEGANENLIYRYKENDKDILIVLLNSSSRYSDISNILSNIYLE